MASQTKITGFYRPTKPNSSAAASKRRKAIVDDPVCDSELNRETKPVIVTDRPETIVQTEKEPNVLLKSDPLKVEPGLLGNSKNIFSVDSEVKKTVQKKNVERRPKKTPKSVENSLKKSFTKPLPMKIPCTDTEIIKEEATSFSDNHDFNPLEVSTPHGAKGSTTSCRKRKMQVVEEQSEVVQNTPEKVVKKSQEVEFVKARKKLEMGDLNIPAKPLEENTSKADALHSPSKPVAFLCMGNLSPRKSGLSSPIKTANSPSLKNKLLQSSVEKRIQNLAEKSFKSPAVKSLAALLDKVPPAKVLLFLYLSLVIF